MEKEGIILEATALNLWTCLVGGFLRREKAACLAVINKEERILAVFPSGYALRLLTLEKRILATLDPAPA